MAVSKKNSFCTMSKDEMEKTNGGAWWEIAIAVWACYEVGYAVGKAIAYATRR